MTLRIEGRFGTLLFGTGTKQRRVKKIKKMFEQWRGEYKMMMEMISDARREGIREGVQEGAEKVAEFLFQNGAFYDFVRNAYSQDILPDEKLREIYDSVM